MNEMESTPQTTTTFTIGMDMRMKVNNPTPPDNNKIDKLNEPKM